ncbi:DUF2975 domain-containing protein [Glycomyces artemisiae]|uniref:DUF2975 family protein n=1 Tax=Glycomyces artemisiae TaxID=1076443 RepID=A0A2T0URP6_9ACTN|nr:DUF2975 domain-containing protein [Glycomyces artemisiae]PRY60601.1 Protein of unknown function (DUF2975) [Glycomyces artemisiae]
MNQFFTLILRLAIAAALLASLFGQIMIVPNSGMLEFQRDYGHDLAPILAAASIIGVACVQVMLVAGWMLLGMIDRDAIFSRKAFRWIDVIIGAALAGVLLSLAVTACFFALDPGIDEMVFFGAMLGLASCIGAGCSFAMLMVIMRGLLRKATELKTEMAEVI